MKATTRLAVLLVGFLVIFVNVGYADGTDPVVKTVGPGGGSIAVTSITQGFSYVSCGSIDGAPPETFCFEGDNESGVDWTNLQVTTNFSYTGAPPTLDDWSCSTSEEGFAMDFASCVVESLTINSMAMTRTVVALYFNGEIPAEDPPDASPDFFTTESGAGITATTGVLNANVPEPGTLALVLTAIGALAARRRLRAGRS